MTTSSSASGAAVFCSAFDEHLALCGPPAVFLLDPEGRWRFDAEWTRDAYGRLGWPDTSSFGGRGGWRWLLARDRDSGFVMRALISATALVSAIGGDRMDVVVYATSDEAVAALLALGSPPIVRVPW